MYMTILMNNSDQVLKIKNTKQKYYDVALSDWINELQILNKKANKDVQASRVSL